VANVYHPHRLVDDYEQNSVSSAIAGADEHLPDGDVEMGAFWRQRIALGESGERFDTCAGANAPPGGRLRSTVPNVTIYVPKVGLGFRRDDDAIT